MAQINSRVIDQKTQRGIVGRGNGGRLHALFAVCRHFAFRFY
jgi:hypothetical protein